MSTIIIQNAVICNPESEFHNKKVSIKVLNGIVEMISETAIVSDDNDVPVIDANSAFLSNGFVDALGFCFEPGEEWKEDLNSFSNAASAGGFTHAALLSGTAPLPYTATAIKQIVNFKSNLPVQLLPLGMPTEKGDGKEMSEMYDMIESGAVGFFNGDTPIEDLGLIQRVLEYLSEHKPVLFFHPFMKSLAIGGLMNEGDVHVKLGLKGIPAIAETTSLNAALAIAQWLDCKIHITRISTKEAADLAIENSNSKISFSVPVMNLLSTDEDLINFDENFKVIPALRAKDDKEALLNALVMGKIKAVVSNHQPQDTEAKKVEFEYSAFGAATIQHTFNLLCTALGENCTSDLIVKVLCDGPRELVNLHNPKFEVGTAADFTLFNINTETEISKEANKSKGVNNPYIGKKVKGNIVATVLNSNYFINN